MDRMNNEKPNLQYNFTTGSMIKLGVFRCGSHVTPSTHSLFFYLQLNGEPLKVDICKHKLTDKHPMQTY